VDTILKIKCHTKIEVLIRKNILYCDASVSKVNESLKTVSLAVNKSDEEIKKRQR
jgi:hypothetical protein